MTLSKDVMMELMAYADGELEPAEMARVERLIAADADAKRLVESMGVLGKVVADLHEAPHAAATEGLVDDIMARVEKEGTPRKSMRPPKVVDLRDRRENRVKVAAGIIAVVALAAGIVLTTRKANEDTPSQVAQAGGAHTTSPQATPVGPGPALDTQVAGVDVDQVDTKNDVQVFYLPSSVQANASSVVVWIDDNGAGK